MKEEVIIEDNFCWKCGYKFKTNEDFKIGNKRKSGHHAIPKRLNPIKNIIIPLCCPCHKKLEKLIKQDMIK